MVDPLDKKLAALTKEFESLMSATGNEKAKKSIINTTKMFKAIKESGGVVADLLTGFQNAGTAKDVFQSVVSDYATYLSDSFWGEILTSIDFDSITAIISDEMAPAMNDLGGAVGELLEGPVGDMLISGISFVADGLTAWAGVLTGNMSILEDLFSDVQWVVDLKNALQDSKDDNLTSWLQTKAGNQEYLDKYGIDPAAQSKKGTAGGVYSGQFDNLDYNLINNMLGLNPDLQEQLLEQSVRQNERLARLAGLLEDNFR